MKEPHNLASQMIRAAPSIALNIKRYSDLNA